MFPISKHTLIINLVFWWLMYNFRDYSSYAVLVIELKDNEAQAQVLSAALEVRL